MNNKLKWLAASSGLAVATLGANPAFAATSTPAGTTFQNTASVSYTVGGVAQTPVSASSPVLTVDRKIIISAATTDTAAVSVTPGQTNTQTKWTITNSSNATIDIGLAFSGLPTGVGFTVNYSTPLNTTNGNTSSIGTPTFTVAQTSSGTTYLNTVGAPFIDELPQDGIVTITLTDTAGLPLTLTNGQYAGILLTATALQGGAAGTKGAVITQNSSGTWGGSTSLNNVLADSATATAGSTDAANNGTYLAADAYIVSAPSLSVIKTSTVISDPVNGNTSPKLIPGAVVRYCIQVANAAGGATATAPAISDSLASLPVTFVASTIKLNGTITAGVCNWDGTAGGAFAGSTVSGTLANLAAGSSESLYFDVTIN